MIHQKARVEQQVKEYQNAIYERDLAYTVKNRARLEKNANLLYWYKKLYNIQFAGIHDVGRLNILEIGSGTSPLRKFVPRAMTSDILRLDYLDHCFDAHRIDEYSGIAQESLDVITMTNVLHHMRNPVEFMLNARFKLKPGGKIIMAEPYFSKLSTFIYCHVHPEPVELGILKPELEYAEGPLSSANIALPFLIFFGQNNWKEALRRYYDFAPGNAIHYTSLSYLFTGGISRKLPVPGFVFRMMHHADSRLASAFPRIFSSFFILTMIRRQTI